MNRKTRILGAANEYRTRLGESSLFRNSGYIMATTVVNSGLGFLFWAAAARVYDPSVVGLAAAVISAMVVTSLVCWVGTDAIVIEKLPKRASGREWSLTVNSALVAGGCASLLGSVVTVTILPRLSEDFASVSGTYALVFVAGTVAWTLSAVLDHVFVAESKSRFMLARNTVLSAAKLVLLGAPLLLASRSSLSIFAPWIVASWLSVVIAVFVFVPRLRRGYSAVFSGIGRQLRELVSRLFGHHLISLSGALPPLVLPILVAARLSPTDNAYFYATWMVGGVFFVVSPAVSSALFAEGSREAGDLRDRTRSSARIIALLLAPLMLAFVVGGQLILSLFGPNYAEEGWPVLLLLIVSAVPDAVTNIRIAMLRVLGRLGFAGALNAGIALTTVGLCWLMLPGLGIEAAALAWLIAQTAGALVVGVDILIRRGSASRRSTPLRLPVR